MNVQKTGDFDSLGRVASYESFSLVWYVFGKSYGKLRDLKMWVKTIEKGKGIEMGIKVIERQWIIMGKRSDWFCEKKTF